jgi:hypothetical protein
VTCGSADASRRMPWVTTTGLGIPHAHDRPARYRRRSAHRHRLRNSLSTRAIHSANAVGGSADLWLRKWSGSEQTDSAAPAIRPCRGNTALTLPHALGRHSVHRQRHPACASGGISLRLARKRSRFCRISRAPGIRTNPCAGSSAAPAADHRLDAAAAGCRRSVDGVGITPSRNARTPRSPPIHSPTRRWTST